LEKLPVQSKNIQSLLFTTAEEAEAMTQLVRNRQETVNKRFKNWEILSVPFRNQVYRHGDAFRSLPSIMTQLSINNGEPLFQVYIMMITTLFHD
jgi:hypothetical protein